MAQNYAIPGMKLVKAPKAKKPKAPPKPKPPCKYGPRTKAGKCPKKPKTLKQAVQRDLASDTRPTSGSSATTAHLGSAAQKAIDKAATAAGNRAAAKVESAIKSYAKERKSGVGALGATVAGAGAAKIAGVALAGLAAYWVTSKILEARQLKRTKRAELAAAAADGYRQARLEAQRLNKGKALSTAQHLELSNAFKAELKKLGLSTTDLGKL